MNYTVFLIIALVLAVSAFFYGAISLFKKGKPLYFQMIVCGVACFALEVLFVAVAVWCNNYNPSINLGIIGLFGCNLFLFSANYDQLDSVLDDGDRTNDRAKLVAKVGTIIIAAVLIIIIVFIIKDKNLKLIPIVIMMLPVCPASYFNIKHLLMPIDDFGFLKATRACNAIVLSFYLFCFICIVGIINNSALVQGISVVLMSATMLLLAVFSVKGAKQWAI